MVIPREFQEAEAGGTGAVPGGVMSVIQQARGVQAYIYVYLRGIWARVAGSEQANGYTSSNPGHVPREHVKVRYPPMEADHNPGGRHPSYKW